LLETLKPAARQYDKAEAENALLALEQCQSILAAVVCASDELSDEARNNCIDLVADVLRQRGADLQRFFDAVVSGRDWPETNASLHDGKQRRVPEAD
jgi:hypothetical protein